MERLIFHVDVNSAFFFFSYMRSFLEIKIGKWTNIVHHHLHVRYHVGFLGNQASLVAVLGQAREA